jgi:hypothetical protein
MVSFPMDAELEAKVRVLVAEGWQLNLTAPPVAVYHLIRPKKTEPVPEPPSPLGKLLINDDLIQVIKAPQT